MLKLNLMIPELREAKKKKRMERRVWRTARPPDQGKVCSLSMA